jgi:DNA-binding transcriptional regulator PaaX
LLQVQQRFVLTFAPSVPQDGRMKPKTQEFLNFLLWSAERLMRPGFRNLTNSYEAWAYRKGLFRQVAALEGQQLLERDKYNLNERIYRLTEAGRVASLGGRDPHARWSRPWDGRWRLVLFDVPVGQNVRRERLRRYLRERHFGCLQGSVWISPDALKEEREILTGSRIDVGVMILMEARPCGDESDQEIVAGAWDFERINGRYSRHLGILAERPDEPLRNGTAAERFRQWAVGEQKAWLDAVSLDPFLPERLLPADYLGRSGWRQRVSVLQKAGKQLRAFKLDA